MSCWKERHEWQPPEGALEGWHQAVPDQGKMRLSYKGREIWGSGIMGQFLVSETYIMDERYFTCMEYSAHILKLMAETVPDV